MRPVRQPASAGSTSPTRSPATSRSAGSAATRRRTTPGGREWPSRRSNDGSARISRTSQRQHRPSPELSWPRGAREGACHISMKTTLKRGVGRAADTNGNGRAVLPPGALTPITRYEQPGKRRGIFRILGRILFVLVLATISLLGGIGGGYWLEGEQTVVDIDRASRSDPNIRKAATKLEIPLPDRPAIAIVVGQDVRRWAKDAERGGRADTVMLMRADPTVGTLSTLSFARYRHTDSDIYRIERQRLFMRALKERLSSSFKLTAIPKLTGVVRKNVKVGRGGNEALDPDEIRSWAFFALQLPSGRVFQSKIGGLSGYAQLTTDPSNIQAAVEEFETPDVNAGEKATAAALGQRPKLAGSRAPAPRRTSIVVLNGNGKTGSAANAGYLLGRRGYQILPPPEGVLANAPKPLRVRTTVFYDPQQRGSRAAARSVANLFGAADEQGAMPPKIAPFANSAMLVVVVGHSFHGNLAPAPVDRTPERQP